MSDQFNRGGKNDGSKKFQSINLSSHFNKPGPKTAAKSTTGRGLQSLGKVSTRRVPRPANLSSLKKENAGNDPNVALVPGTGGWGSKKEIEIQVEPQEGDKGWKEMGKVVKKPPAFSQDFPSLGEEAPPPNDKLELRPQTGKWGETPLPKKECGPTEEPVVAPIPINQTFGMVQMPMYGMVPVPGSMYPGVPGAIFRPIYPPGAPQAIYNGAPPPALVPYMYAAPPSFPKHTKERTNSTSSQGDKAETSETPKVLKAVEESWGNSAEPSQENNKSADHWGDEAYEVPVTCNKAPAPVEVTSQSGYFSPYTQPFPQTSTVTKSSPGPTLEERHEPAGKAADDGKKITYHGRTSSHSSMSETPEDELAHDFEDKLDLNNNSTAQQARVISRSLAKKQLKAFPKEDDSPVKQITKQVSVEQEKGEQKPFAWDDDTEEVEKKSVWEDRCKEPEVKPSPWNMPLDRPEADGQQEDNEPSYFKSQVGFLDNDQVDLKPAPSSSRRQHSRYEAEFQVNDRIQYDERNDRRDTQFRHDDSSYRQSDRSSSYGRNQGFKTDREEPSDARRKAIEETSKILKSLPNKKSPKVQSEESGPPVQIQIKKPQRVEILQKPPQPEPIESDKPKQPETNYWEAKRLEREKKEQEEELLRKEKQKAEALKVRAQQYQDYRTAEQYSDSRDYRDGREESRDSRRRPTYDEERSEREKERRGIRKRGEEDSYRERPDRSERAERPERRAPRHPREERGEGRRESSYRRRDDRARDYRPREGRDRPRDAVYKERPQRNRTERPPRSERPAKVDSDEAEQVLEAELEDGAEYEDASEVIPEPQEAQHSETKQASDQIVDEETPVEAERKPRPERKPRSERSAPRERRDRYDKDYSDRPEKERYRREPRPKRERREPRERPRYNERAEVLDMNNTDRNGNPMDERPRNERYTRADRPRATAERKRASAEDRKANEEGSDEVPAPRPRREHRETKFVPRVPPPPPAPVAPPVPVATEVTEETPVEDRTVKSEREARRGKKGPSLAYYNPNPAERLKQRTRTSGEASVRERRKEISGEKRVRQERERPPKNSKPRTKKEPAKNLPKKEEKPEEAVKAEVNKPKDVPIVQKPKEKRESEHDRLLRMTKSGVDLTRMGIYAVEGKDLEDTQSQVDENEGFVEVVRKKPKKEPEPEKVEKKTSSGKSKKTKKSDKSKKTVEKDQPGTITPTTTQNSSSEKQSPIMKWSGGAMIDSTPLFGSNIWARKNAWEKPLTFTDKQTIEAKELLAPLTSGESTSLFSSDADLAKKIRAKYDDKSWKNGESRPPRFSKMLPEKHKDRAKHRASKESLSDSAIEKPLPQRPSMKKRAEVIPPGVEDLFGLRSDGEDDKPTLSSLVLDSAPAAAIIPAVGLSQKSADSSEVARECQTSPDITDHSAETSTQTTPPAIKHPDQETPHVVPSAPPEEPDSPPPLNSPGVEQLITSAAGLSLTEQLREIGQAQNLPQLGAPVDRSQLFGTMPFGIQGSPINMAMQNNLLQEPPHTPPTASISQHLMNFAPPREIQNSPHSLLHINSPRQIGPLGAPGSAPFPMNNQMMSNSHHGINSSSFSNLTNLTNQRPTSADFLKSYMSPMSPTNKVYATQNPQSSFVNQTIHQFMSTPFMSSSGNYPSPTMSPQPSHSFNQPMYQAKPVSPKVQQVYNTAPNNMFEAFDMMSNQRQSQSSLANQQMFFQMQQRFNNRMMPADMQQLYTMKQNDNILLQSDMTKHVDAKPFNPSLGVPPPVPMMGRNMFKPDILQQAMMTQQATMMQPRYPVKQQIDPRRAEFMQHQMKKEENVNMMNMRPQPALTPAGQQLPTNMQQVPPANFLQQQQQQQQQQHMQSMSARPDMHFMPQSNMAVRPQGRPAPRVKLARDGRLHRIPDMMPRKYSNQSSSLIPHSLQQQMQQQSLAQVQQYTAALSESENAPKAVLPDNMKPSPKKSSEMRSYPGQRIPPEPLARPVTPPVLNSPVHEKSPPPPVTPEVEETEEVVEEVKEEKEDEAPVVKRQAEKRKYNERRGERESRPYRGGRDQYRMEYNGHGYDGFNGYGNDYGPPMHRGGYRGGYPPRYPPPHRGMYRGGGPPRGPPRGHPDFYRGGGRGRPRY